jgi:hypothetical protein
MKDIIIYKAQTTVEPVESVIIHIASEVPTTDTLEHQRNLFENEAFVLCNVLEKSLPGGVFDRLLVEMMKRKVSSFVVPINS